MLRRCIWLLVCLLPCLAAEAQSAGGGNMPFSLNLGLNPATGPEDVDVSIQVLFILTILALSPTIILLMTSFTRIVVVLSFIRSAMSLQSAPSSQIVVGLSLFMSLFVMAPTWSKIQTSAVGPYSEKQITKYRSPEQCFSDHQGVHAQANPAQGHGAFCQHVWRKLQQQHRAAP